MSDASDFSRPEPGLRRARWCPERASRTAGRVFFLALGVHCEVHADLHRQVALLSRRTGGLRRGAFSEVVTVSGGRSICRGPGWCIAQDAFTSTWPGRKGAKVMLPHAERCARAIAAWILRLSRGRSPLRDVHLQVSRDLIFRIPDATVPTPMPLSYLRQIERATLPLTVTDPREVRQVELLRAALVITATLRRATPASQPHSAVVHEITPAGRLLLRRGGA